MLMYFYNLITKIFYIKIECNISINNCYSCSSSIICLQCNDSHYYLNSSNQCQCLLFNIYLLLKIFYKIIDCNTTLTNC